MLIADGDAVARHFGAIDAESYVDRRSGGEIGIEHAVLKRLRLAQNGEARRAVERDAAVVLAFLAGDQRVDRRVEAERGGVFRHVGDDAVGDENAAGDLLGRHVIDELCQIGEERGPVAVGAVGRMHLADFEVAERFKAVLQRGDGGRGLCLAVAEMLAAAVVDNEGHHAGQSLALLALQNRIGQRQDQERRGERAKHRAANALPMRAPRAR